MSKARFKEKVIKKPKFNSSNHYLPLMPNDALYRPNLSLLKSPEFKNALQRMTADINFLLMMNEQQFWRELEENQSVLISLESCLAVLPKRDLDKYDKSGQPQFFKLNWDDSVLKIYSELFRAVLLVYYRISEAKTKDQKQILYDFWLLDIPKLLDLAHIYGPSNPTIIKQLIANIYQAYSNYDGDTLDFFSMVEQHDLLRPPGERMVEIDFSPKSLTRKNFGNPEKFMIQEASTEIFLIKELLVNLTNFFVYFPIKYARELAVDYKIQERLLMGLAIHLKESAEDWKLGNYEKYFEWQFEDIRQCIAKYFIQEFKILKEILEGNDAQLMDLAQCTYLTICFCFSENQKKPETPYYRRMINHLIENTEKPPFFFLSANKIKKVDSRTQSSINFCCEYENKYRKEKEKKSQARQYDEVYEKFKKTFLKFRDLTAKTDTANMKKKEKEWEEQRRKREPSDIFLTWNKMKYKDYGPEYYDQMEEEDQFRRAEDKERNPINNMPYTQMKVVPFKKKKYISKPEGKLRDEQLSVWDLTSINDQDLSFQSNSSFSRESSKLGRERKKGEKSVFLQQQHTLNFQESTANVQNESMNLSVFEQKGEDKNHNEMSFSIMSSVKGDKDEQLLDFEEEKTEDNKELESILADINISVSSTVRDSTQKADFEIAGEDFQNEERFAWQDDDNLSFEIELNCW